MQPYFLPYIGYFQLINAVDTFVFFDDVNFINKGWINRNNLLIDGKSKLFTIPLKDTSQNKKINEIYIADDQKWQIKLIKTIFHNYSKAPFFEDVFPIIERIIKCDSNKISDFNLNAIIGVIDYMEISTNIVTTSSIYNNNHLKSQDRIIDICKREGADIYINPIGGGDLYNKDDFDLNRIQLRFIKPKNIIYKQFNNEFVPWLSIFDILMFNDKEQTCDYLNQYTLI